MRIDASTIDELVAKADELGHDLRPVDAAAAEALPGLRRWFADCSSITMIGYGEIPAGFTSGDTTWPLVGIAPQKRAISVYVAGWVDGVGIAESYAGRMGATDNGVGCIRFRDFAKVDRAAFQRALADAATWAASNPTR